MIIIEYKKKKKKKKKKKCLLLVVPLGVLLSKREIYAACTNYLLKCYVCNESVPFSSVLSHSLSIKNVISQNAVSIEYT